MYFLGPVHMAEVQALMGNSKPLIAFLKARRFDSLSEDKIELTVCEGKMENASRVVSQLKQKKYY